MLQNLGEGDRRVVSQLLHMPLASAEDIAAVQDRTVSGVHTRLRRLAADRLVESVDLGSLRPRAARYFLPEGLLEQWGLAGVTWHQPGTLARLLERVTSVEHLYPAAAAIKSLGQLQTFQWVDGVSFDAAVQYEKGWVALFWVGLLRSEQGFEEHLEKFGTDLQELASGDDSPRPSLLCCVVIDLWQVELVLRVVRRYEMENWVSVRCIADNKWYGAPNHGQPGRGWVHQPVYRRNLSRPAWDRRIEQSLWSAEGSQDAARLLHAAAQFPGMDIRFAQSILGEKTQGRRAQNTCVRLEQLGLLRRWQHNLEYRYCLTPKGMLLLANLDRTTLDSAWTQHHMEDWYSPEDIAAHEYGLLELLEYFIAADCPVACGTRDSESLGSHGGIAPDAMVHVQSPFGSEWHYAEYERSARSPSAVARKLRGYDSTRRSNQAPALVVCIDDVAEENFRRAGNQMGIKLLTTTIERFHKYGAVNSPGCWSNDGELVIIG